MSASLTIDRMVSQAVALLRDQHETEFNRYLRKLAVEGAKAVRDRDAETIYMHKAMVAGYNFWQAHEYLCPGTLPVWPCSVWGLDLIDLAYAAVKDDVEEAYERVDAAVEDAALSDFHRKAYGDAA